MQMCSSSECVRSEPFKEVVVCLKRDFPVVSYIAACFASISDTFKVDRRLTFCSLQEVIDFETSP